jgi:hypothetical protein
VTTLSKKLLTLCLATVSVAALTLGHAVYAQDKKTTTTPPSAKVTKPPSACKGLDETACKAKTTECTWITPKTGKPKPHCRSKPKIKKKDAPSKDAPPKDAPPKK